MNYNPATIAAQSPGKLVFICAGCGRRYLDPGQLWECAERHLEGQRRLRYQGLGGGRKLTNTDTLDCVVSPGPLGCLSCPLAACKYDDPAPYQAWLGRHTRAKAEAIVAAFFPLGTARTTARVREAADSLGVTERSMYRILAREKKEAK